MLTPAWGKGKIWVHDKIWTHNLEVILVGHSNEPSKTAKLTNSLSVAQWLERLTGSGRSWVRIFFLCPIPFFANFP